MHAVKIPYDFPDFIYSLRLFITTLNQDRYNIHRLYNEVLAFRLYSRTR